MKSICFFLFVFILGCNGQTKKNEKLIDALKDDNIEIRGNLVELGINDYRLDYYDVYEKDSHYKFLEAKGYQGGGPSWYGIIYGAIKMSEPTILKKIRFDDEAEGLAIWSSDKKTLIKIGKLISVVKSDKNILLEAIKVAEKNWKME